MKTRLAYENSTTKWLRNIKDKIIGFAGSNKSCMTVLKNDNYYAYMYFVDYEKFYNTDWSIEQEGLKYVDI